MEYLTGSLYMIPVFMTVKGHDLSLLTTWSSLSGCVRVDLGCRRRFSADAAAYLVHWEADGAAWWEPVQMDEHLEMGKDGKEVFKLSSYLKSRGYQCVCRNVCTIEEYRRSDDFMRNIILSRNGHLCWDYDWHDGFCYTWSMNYHRPSLLAIDGRDVWCIVTAPWVSKDLLRDQKTKDALMETCEKPTAFTGAGFARWLTDLGMGDSLPWIEVHFWDNKYQAVSEWVGKDG